MKPGHVRTTDVLTRAEGPQGGEGSEVDVGEDETSGVDLIGYVRIE